MQTMDPQSPEYKMLLMGVIANTGLTHRTQIIDMLKNTIQQAQQIQQMQLQQASNPETQGLQAQLSQLELQAKVAEAQARVVELQSRARLQDVKAQNQMLEPQFRRMEIATKGIYQVAENQQKQEFDRRLALADRVLKAKDIESNERIAKIQASGNVASTQAKSAATVASEQAEPLTLAMRYAAMPDWMVGIVAFGSVVASTAVCCLSQRNIAR